MFFNKIKNTCRWPIVSNIYKHFSTSRTNAELLMDYLGLSKNEAYRYVKYNKLLLKDPDKLMSNLKLCKNLGFTKDEIFENSRLLAINSITLHNSYLIMKEGGFNVSPYTLVRYRYYFNKLVSELKMLELINNDVNVQESFIKSIQTLPKGFHIEPATDATRFREIHLNVLKEFLKRELECTDEAIVKLFRIHQMISSKSLQVVQENLALARQLGFSNEKMLNYGYILHNYPSYPKTVLKEYPDLAGANMAVSMRCYPKVMMCSPTNMVKIYGALKEHDVPDSAIRRYMNVFSLSPETVKLRLQEIDTVPELKLLKSHDQFLKLVIHHTRTKTRLNYLQNLQLKCADTLLLGFYNNFNDRIKVGKDTNSRTEVYKFLRNHFNCEPKQIRKRWALHPYSFHVPLIEMDRTFKFLRKLEYSLNDIFQCIHIILYPIEKIKVVLDLMRNHEEINYMELSNIQKLNLILYFIEKEHHFTGNGIWAKCDEPVEEIEKVGD